MNPGVVKVYRRKRSRTPSMTRLSQKPLHLYPRRRSQSLPQLTMPQVSTGLQRRRSLQSLRSQCQTVLPTPREQETAQFTPKEVASVASFGVS